MNIKKVHEEYHSKIKLQKRIISNKNFTYRNILLQLNKLSTNNRLNILDIGSGVGTIDFYLAKKGHLISGVDISEKAVSIAKINAKGFGLKKIKFYVGNVNEFKFSSKFDLILCSEIIEHVKDDNKLLNDLGKHLKNNGKIFLTTPLESAPLYKLGLTKKFDKRVGHRRRYSLKQLRKLTNRNGLKISEVFYQDGAFRNIFFIFPVFDQVVRLANRVEIISDTLTQIDNIFFNLFGPTDIGLIIIKK